jgi:hypothetical protein
MTPRSRLSSIREFVGRHKCGIYIATGIGAAVAVEAVSYVLTGRELIFGNLLSRLYNVQPPDIQAITTTTHTTTQTIVTSTTRTITQTLTQAVSIQPYEVVRLLAQKDGTTYNTFLQYLSNIKMPYDIIGQGANDDAIIAAMEKVKLHDSIWDEARRKVAGKPLDAIAVRTPNGLFIFDEMLSILKYAFQL